MHGVSIDCMIMYGDIHYFMSSLFIEDVDCFLLHFYINMTTELDNQEMDSTQNKSVFLCVYKMKAGLGRISSSSE